MSNFKTKMKALQALHTANLRDVAEHIAAHVPASEQSKAYDALDRMGKHFEHVIRCASALDEAETWLNRALKDIG